MQATVSRSEALRLLKIEHAAVAALIAELSAEEMTRPDTIRHGLYADQQCSFKDLLAHLICYEVHTLAAIADWQRGVKHPVIDAVHDPQQSRRLHYGGIAERARLSLAAQLQEYQQVSRALEAALDGLADAEWTAAAFYPTRSKTNLGGMIESIMVMPPRPMYRHLPVHIPDARAYAARLRQPAQ